MPKIPLHKSNVVYPIIVMSTVANPIPTVYTTMNLLTLLKSSSFTYLQKLGYTTCVNGVVNLEKIEEILPKVLNTDNKLAPKYLETIRPVSYTHLDVYKRQI